MKNIHMPPPRNPNKIPKAGETSFHHHIPCLLLSNSPLLQTQKRTDEFARQVLLAKYMYSKCDPLVRTFVSRGSTDEGVNFKLSREIGDFSPGRGSSYREVITDESTGVSFSFETISKKPTIRFKPDQNSDWFNISNENADFMYLASLQMTLRAIIEKDSELSHLREVELARSKVLAMYGNK